MKTYLAALSLLLGTLWACHGTAQIYKNVDKEGNVSYSDKRIDSADSQELELPPINTTPGLDLDQLSQQQALPPEQFKLNYTLTLHSPTNGTHLLAHQRDLNIKASFKVSINSNSADQDKIDAAQQAAMASTTIKLYLDNKLLPSENGQATVKEITRGEHIISARLFDANGNLLGQPVNATVWVHRPRIKQNPPIRR